MSTTATIRAGNAVRIEGTVTNADGTPLTLDTAPLFVVLRRVGQPLADAAFSKVATLGASPGEWSVDLNASETRAIRSGAWPIALIVNPDSETRRQFNEADPLATLRVLPETVTP